ncbi:MAG TPA: 2-phospho-L-lactate guanylyltransferase, partial [Steroidobacteraceae bacterium]
MACNLAPMSEESGRITGDSGPRSRAPSMAGAIWAVVPVKRLAAAKQRLSAALGEAREDFAYLLACRIFDVLQGADMIAGVIVVTPDPRVGAAARARGAVVVDDEDSSLNQACVLGVESAASRGASLAVLLPSDLATLTTQGLERLLRTYLRLPEAESGAIGLVRCKEGTGTNLVLVPANTPFEPSFGPGSFSRHAQGSGSAVHELEEPTVSFDIDTPEDLEALRATFEAGVEGGPLASLLCQSVAWVGRPPTRPAPRATPSPGATPSMPPSALAQALTALPSSELAPRAAALRDLGHGALVTYSRKVFLPLTQLCRDSCHYCTFAKAPRRLESAYLSIEAAVSVAAEGAGLGCKEALFTLGE